MSEEEKPKNKGGRPRNEKPSPTKSDHKDGIKKKYEKWTEERLEDLSERMWEYFKENEHAYTFEGFFARQDDVPWYDGLLKFLCNRSPSFFACHSRVKALIKDRLVSQGIKNPKINGVAYKLILLNQAQDMINPDEKSTHIHVPPTFVQLNAPTAPRQIEATDLVETPPDSNHYAVQLSMQSSGSSETLSTDL
jgi:hypothetical protein